MDCKAVNLVLWNDSLLFSADPTLRDALEEAPGPASNSNNPIEADHAAAGLERSPKRVFTKIDLYLGKVWVSSPSHPERHV